MTVTLLALIVFLLGLSCLLAYIIGRRRTTETDLLEPQDGEPKNVFPILLVHGTFPITSLEKLAKSLRSQGYICQASALSPLEDIETRSRQLEDAIKIVLKKGYKAVHLICHSAGGLDARYLLIHSDIRENIFSVTTLATPHEGIRLFSLFLTRSLCFVCQPWIHIYCRLAIPRSRKISSLNLLGSLGVLKAGLFEKNTQNFNGHTHCFSYSGIFRKPQKKTLSWLLPWILYWITYLLEGENDGVVSVESSKWQVFRGIVPSSHFGLIGNKIYGQEKFDAELFYLNLSSELRKLEKESTLGFTTQDRRENEASLENLD